MADAKSLFDKGEDVTHLFDQGQEVAPSTTPTEYSTLGAGAMGAAKGATLGFDDEIAGVAAAATKKVGGSDQDFWDIYRQIRDDVRQQHVMAEEQHPYASVGGELVGGLATTALTPLGAIGQVGKAASLGQKVAGMAKAGAAAGALTGLGAGNTELTTGDVGNIEKAAGETAVGGAVGGVSGMAGQIIGSGLAKVGGEIAKGAKSLPFSKQVTELAKRTYAGEDLLGKTTEMAQETRNTAEMFLDAFNTLKSVTGKEYGQAYKELEKSGEKVDLNKLSDLLQTEINTLKPKGAENKAQIDKLKSTIQDILDENKITSTGEASILPDVGLSPKNKAAETVQTSMTTAVAKDKEQLAQLLNKADELKPLVGDEPSREYLNILGKINNLKDRIPESFTPEIRTEALTGRTVHVAPRGIGTPVAAAEKTGLPVEQVTEQINPLTSSPEQAKSSLTALSEYINQAQDAGSNVGEIYGIRAKEALKGSVEDATKNQPDIQRMINSASERLGSVKKGLEQIGETTDLNSTIDRLEGAIRQYKRPGSQGERDVNLALDELRKSFPEEAEGLKRMVESASTREDLARALSGVSAFGKGIKETLRTGDVMGALGAGVHASTLQGVRLGAMGTKGVTEGAAKARNVIANTTRAVYDMAPDQLQGLADFAAASGGKMGDMVSNTIRKVMDAPLAKRRALLFTLLQQPGTREVIEKYNPSGTFGGQ